MDEYQHLRESADAAARDPLAETLRAHADPEGRILPPLVEVDGQTRFATPEEFAAQLREVPLDVHRVWRAFERATYGLHVSRAVAERFVEAYRTDKHP